MHNNNDVPFTTGLAYLSPLLKCAQFCSRVYNHAIRTDDVKCVKHCLRPSIVVQRTANGGTLFRMYELPRGGIASCAFVAYGLHIDSVQIATEDVSSGCQYARTIGREGNTM